MADQLEKIGQDDLSLRDILEILWRGRKVTALLAVLMALGSTAYSLLSIEWYRAEVVLAPAEQEMMTPLGTQLGGLAAFAGISVSNGDSAQALAVLKSRDLARAFVNDLSLTQVFFAAEWDAANTRWRDPDQEDWPDVRDAVEYLHDDLMKVREDRKTGLVTLSIEWTDPDIAAEWATALVQRANAAMRDRALQQSEANIVYLESELKKTDLVALQEAIGSLLRSELQRLMLARGNEEFAFRTLDPALAPKDPVRPQVALTIILGTFLGVVIGAMWSFARWSFGAQPKRRNEDSDPVKS